MKCNHCGQQLAVRRSESVIFTEAVERFADTAETLSDQLEELTRQNRLAELDRRWEQQREEFMISGKNGQRHLPDESSALLSGVGTVVFGCIWIAVATGITSTVTMGLFGSVSLLFPAFGILVVVVGVVTSIGNYQKATAYRAALLRYEAERSRLLGEEATP